MRSDRFHTIRGALIAGLILLGLGLVPVRGEVEFIGLLSTKDRNLFVLIDRTTDTKSGWISLQQSFAGFTLSGYDPKEGTLALTKDGATTRIGLNVSHVQEAKLSFSGTIASSGSEKVEIEKATLTLGQDNSFPFKIGVVLHLTPKLLPDGRVSFLSSWDLPEPDGRMKNYPVDELTSTPGRLTSFALTLGIDRDLVFSFTVARE